MRKFNKTIEVKVSVDKIANELLGTHAGSSFPHAELLVETIIGAALNSGHIGMIYAALNGWDSKLDFTVGKAYECTRKTYSWVGVEGARNQEYVQMGTVKVIEVNEFDLSKPINVEYTYIKKDGTKSTQTEWVSTDDLKEIVSNVTDAALPA